MCYVLFLTLQYQGWYPRFPDTCTDVAEQGAVGDLFSRIHRPASFHTFTKKKTQMWTFSVWRNHHEPAEWGVAALSFPRSGSDRQAEPCPGSAPAAPSTGNTRGQTHSTSKWCNQGLGKPGVKWHGKLDGLVVSLLDNVSFCVFLSREWVRNRTWLSCL